MYEEDLDAKTPPDETIIWRYMSLDKYIDLLYRKELFLCRLDKLIDPWEGSWSKQEIEESPYKEDDLKGPDGLIQEFKRWSFGHLEIPAKLPNLDVYIKCEIRKLISRRIFALF